MSDLFKTRLIGKTCILYFPKLKDFKANIGFELMAITVSNQGKVHGKGQIFAQLIGSSQYFMKLSIYNVNRNQMVIGPYYEYDYSKDGN